MNDKDLMNNLIIDLWTETTFSLVDQIFVAFEIPSYYEIDLSNLPEDFRYPVNGFDFIIDSEFNTH